MGSSIFFSYPELSAKVGIQGTFVYAATSALPLFVFIFVTPIIRRKLPDGFILTAWVYHRYGPIAQAYISFLTLATMFLYMVAELSALQGVIGVLTGLDGLAPVIVQVVVTTIYTSLGGFKVSFVTDNVQGVMILSLLVICSIAVGTTVNIDTSLIGPSELTKPSLLGYQLIYVILIGIICSDVFLSSFWMRAFASRTDKDLTIGVSIAAVFVFIILALVGSTGAIAVWAGFEEPGSMAFFYLLSQLPTWVVGFVIIMVVSLSTAIFDSLQSAMVSTASNDLFRNKIGLIWIRALVVLIIIPVIILALRVPSILQIFLIGNLAASAAVPCLFLGLSDKFYFLHGIDVTVGGLGGIFSVFLFGLAFYDGDAQAAGDLILMQTLYAQDWSVFGAFVAAPVGGLIFTALSLTVRVAIRFVICKVKGIPFDAFDKPIIPNAPPSEEASLQAGNNRDIKEDNVKDV